MDKAKVRQLVELIERGLGAGQNPDLRVVPVAEGPVNRLFDSITRDSHLQRIRYLARGYGLRWLVEQATFDRPGLDSLEDHELVDLHRDMDRAMECRREGISFEDADLVKPMSGAGDFEVDQDSWGNDDFRMTG